jgi:hypothetical protein
MPDQKPILRGLDSPEHLRAWMEAAGREFLVLRVADILDMTEDYQRLGLDWIAMACGGSAPNLEGPQLRSHIQGAGINGYINIPRDGICSLSLDDLQVVQQWLSVYRDVRLGKGEPSRIDPCEKCGGLGTIAREECGECGGEGRIITFLEISDEEAVLSEGGNPW